MREELTLYHGTRDHFDPSLLRASADGGIHLGTAHQALARGGAKTGRILEVRVALERVARVADRTGSWASSVARARRRGMQALVYLNRHEGIALETILRAEREGVNLDALGEQAFRRFAAEASDAYVVIDASAITEIRELARSEINALAAASSPAVRTLQLAPR